MDKVNLETTKAWGKRRILAELNIKIWMVRRLPQLISTHKIALPSRIMRQRFGRFSSKRRSKHALNSIRKSCKLQNYWFECDELRKSHKSTASPICQTLFPPPPLTSMRCIKTISLPGMASYLKSLMTSHSVMEMCSSCFMLKMWIA